MLFILMESSGLIMNMEVKKCIMQDLTKLILQGISLRGSDYVGEFNSYCTPLSLLACSFFILNKLVLKHLCYTE